VKLFAHVSIHLKRNGAGVSKVFFEAQEQLGKRKLATTQQPVGVERLSGTGSGRRTGRKPIALEDGDMFEVICERPSGTQAAYSGTDYNGLLADKKRHE
jgi:hypothetical protein